MFSLSVSMPGEDMSPRRDVPAKDLRCYGREGAVQASRPLFGLSHPRGKQILTRLETGFVASQGQCCLLSSFRRHSMHNRDAGQEAGSAFAYVKEAAGRAVWDDLPG
jgi:hypothetical protein